MSPSHCVAYNHDWDSATTIMLMACLPVLLWRNHPEILNEIQMARWRNEHVVVMGLAIDKAAVKGRAGRLWWFKCIGGFCSIKIHIIGEYLLFKWWAENTQSSLSIKSINKNITSNNESEESYVVIIKIIHSLVDNIQGQHICISDTCKVNEYKS